MSLIPLLRSLDYLQIAVAINIPLLRSLSAFACRLCLVKESGGCSSLFFEPFVRFVAFFVSQLHDHRFEFVALSLLRRPLAETFLIDSLLGRKDSRDSHLELIRVRSVVHGFFQRDST